jgi:3-mercaptopyruvate sulfurtransferase SseA
MTGRIGCGPLTRTAPSWAADNLLDALIVDTQPHLDDHLRAHLPGAVFCEETTLRVSLGGSPWQPISAEMASLPFSRLGIERDAPVVYTSKDEAK